MRGLTKFAQVEGHISLVRDMSSNAIISTDDAGYNAYKTRREIEKKRQEHMLKNSNEIEELKNEMLEIKQLLNMLIANKG